MQVLANQTLSKARIRVLELVQELSVFFPAEGVLIWDNKSKGFLLDILNELHVSSESLSMNSFVDTVNDIRRDVENLPVGAPGEQVAQLAHLKLRLKGLKLELSQAIQGNEPSQPKGQLEPVPTPAAEEKPIDDTDIADKLAELKRRYAESLHMRLNEIRELWNSFNSTEYQEETVLGLLNRFHKLAGNAASFGYQDLGKTAADLNAAFKKIRDAAARPDSDTVEAIAADLSHLFELGEAVTGESQAQSETIDDTATDSPSTTQSQNDHLIYLVDDDTRLAQFLAIQLEHQGYQVRLIPAPNQLEAAIGEQRPSLILMDISFPEGESAGIKTISELREKMDIEAPVVFLSQKNDLETRMAAARARGEAYFPKPVDVSQLIETIYSLTKKSQAGGQHLAVLHDSPEMTRALCKRLEGIGMETHCLESAEQLLNALDQQNPDILVISRKAGGLNGVDLALMLHQQYQYQNLPVIFLNGDQDQLGQLEHLANIRSFQESSDDTALVQLIERISQQLSRIRQQALKASRKDSLTGLHSRSHFMEMLELLEATTELDNKQFGLLLLKLDNYETLRADFGIEAGDDLVRQTADLLREAGSSDLIARISEDEFCLVNDFGDNETLLKSAADLKSKLQEHPFSFDNQQMKAEVSVGHGLIDRNNNSHAAMHEAMSILHKSQKNGSTPASAAAEEKAAKTAEIAPPPEEPAASRQSAQASSDKATQSPAEKIKEARLRFQAVVNLRGGDSEHYRASLAIKTNTGNDLSASRYLNDFGNPAMAHPLIHLTMKYVIAAVKSAKQPPPVIFIDLPESCVLDAKLAVWIAKQLKDQKMLKNPFVFLLHENNVLHPKPGLDKYLKALTAAGCKIGMHTVSSEESILSANKQGKFSFVRLRRKLLHGSDSSANLKSIQRTAHRVGMEVIAYGVESPEALTHSWSHQLDYVQGDFIHKADDKMDFEFLKFQ